MVISMSQHGGAPCFCSYFPIISATYALPIFVTNIKIIFAIMLIQRNFLWSMEKSNEKMGSGGLEKLYKITKMGD